MSVEEFATVLGMGRTKAYELVKSGEVYSERFGRRYFIPRTELPRKRNAA